MTPVNGIFKFIEKTGFFVQFLIVDTLSMVLPRTILGLNRDKDKIGHYNYQAGLEELGRESLSGPTMNIIPMVISAMAINHFVPAVKLDSPVITGLNETLLKTVTNKNSTDALKDTSKLSTKTAEQIFDTAFGDFKFKDAKDATNYKAKFVSLLNTAQQEKKPNLFVNFYNTKIQKKPSAYTKAEDDFDKLVVEINNANINNAEAPADAHKLVLKAEVPEVRTSEKTLARAAENEISTSSKTFFEDFHHYSNDIIKKFSKATVEKPKEFLEAAAKKVARCKMGVAGLAFLSVGAFLLYLPKIYQLSKLSPAEQSAERVKKEMEGGKVV